MKEFVLKNRECYRLLLLTMATVGMITFSSCTKCSPNAPKIEESTMDQPSDSGTSDIAPESTDMDETPVEEPMEEQAPPQDEEIESDEAPEWLE